MKYPIPYIIFEATRQCNLQCLYCYNHWRRNESKPERPLFSEANKTISKILRVIDFKHITFTGGEPFLADGLKELILKCRLNNRGVTLLTNGTMGTEEDYAVLDDLGLSLIELPFHSDIPGIHDSLTGETGSFNKVIDSIRCISKTKINLCVVCVLTQKNIGRLRQTLLFAEQSGIRRFMLARFNIGGRGIRNLLELLPSLAELRSAFKTANDFTRSHEMSISANVCVPFCVIDPREYPGLSIASCASDVSKMPLTIDYSGDVRLCNHSPTIMGNIHASSISSILSSGYVKEWESAQPGYCAHCRHWMRCRGGCKAASEQLGNTLIAQDPIIDLLKIKRKTENALEAACTQAV
jgi:radical SAM protein with 4Fe4S-binding SPASM domain